MCERAPGPATNFAQPRLWFIVRMVTDAQSSEKDGDSQNSAKPAPVTASKQMRMSQSENFPENEVLKKDDMLATKNNVKKMFLTDVNRNVKK